MGVRTKCTTGRWAINGEPIYVPDPDPDYGLEAVYSSDSGRTEAGNMWKRRVTSKRTVTLKYNYITGAEKQELVDATFYADFSVTYYDNGIQTISSAYVGSIKYKGYSMSGYEDEGGLYEGLELDIVEN